MAVGRWVGLISLIGVGAGFGLCTLFDIRIGAEAFEAGTVGALADWYAVEALFRRLGPHSDILRRRRESIETSIVDLVQNQWLTPAAIREHLKNISPSAHVVAFLEESKNHDQVIAFLRQTLEKLVAELDRPESVAFLERMLKARFKDLDLAQPLGQWIVKTVHSGGHEPFLDAILDSLNQEVTHSAEVQAQVHKAMDAAFAALRKERPGLAFIADGVKVLFGDEATANLVDRDGIAKAITAAIAQGIHDVRFQPGNPVRRKFNDWLLDYGQRLVEGDAQAVAAVERFKTQLVENAEVHAIVTTVLSKVKAELQRQLQDAGSPLMQSVDGFFKGLLNELRTDPASKAKVDAWVRELICAFVDKNHALIGDIVSKNLGGMSDDQLVTQIKSKTWEDLQFIRLNGAVVGFLVGLLLALARSGLSR